MKEARERFLLVDTSDRIAMVGLYEGDRVLSETRAGVGRPTLEWACGAISEAQRSASISLRELDFVACGIGPGGFTSVRIGLSLVNAIGQSLDLPRIGVNRLEASAMGHSLLHPHAGQVRYVVRLPAARDLEYVAFYRITNGALPVCIREPAALSSERVSKLRLPRPASLVTAHPDVFYLGLPRVAHLRAKSGLPESSTCLLPLYLRGATLGPPGGALKVARRRQVR